MTHDNVTDIVERLVAEKYESDEHGIWAIPRNPEGREAAQVIATLRKQLENAREALRHIKIEAEREQGHWQHLKRVIAVHAAEALKGQPDNKPSGIPVDSPTSIQHDKSGYTP